MENKQKWYAIEHDGYWGICDAPVWEKHVDVLAAVHVGEEQARENAMLCASAPEMRELLRDMYLWLDMFSGTRDCGENHPVPDMVERYEQLEKDYEL